MKDSGMMKKIKFFESMGFGVLLLVLILILSVIGTVLPQGRAPQFYSESYSAYMAQLILSLGLHRIYTSVLFAGLFTALSLNLLLCSTVRLGKIVKKMRNVPDTSALVRLGIYPLGKQKADLNLFKGICRLYGVSGIQKHKHRNGVYYFSKNKLGHFGSWFLHLGIMLVILFYIYGQATFFTGDVYGVPGEAMPLEGTNYRTEIKEFDVQYRADGSVSQYTTKLELLDQGGRKLVSGSLNVNNPLRYNGYSFYQTGMGWAADCKIYKGAELIKSGILYEKAASHVPDEKIGIALMRFYPDFAATENGFVTQSDRPNNPAMLYAVYYRNELVKMDIVKPGDAIKWNQYSFGIDEFRRYTYLQVNKMQGQLGAALGGLLMLGGLLLTFYFKPGILAVMQQDNGLVIYGSKEIAAMENNKVRDKKIRLFLNKKEEGIDVR